MPFDANPIINFDPSTTGNLGDNIYLVSELNSWIRETQNILQELKQLPENWNSYGSPKVTSEALNRSQELIRIFALSGMSKPQIFPVSGGGIQFEWQGDKGELEIEILPNGDILYLIVDENEDTDEGKISPNFTLDVSRLAKWYRQKRSISEFLISSL